MALNSNTQRALVDLLLTILSCILSFLTKRFGSSEDETTETLTSRQQTRLAKVATKVQSLIS